jgi:hypothetical protein
MKLKEIEHKKDYQLLLTFTNGEKIDIDLENLVSSYVKLHEVTTATVNQEWGCLEFNGGKVDIEPKTLYNFTKNHLQKIN